MENEILQKKYYLSEFSHCDGSNFIILNIVEICTVKNLITIAVTNEGKISVQSFDLKIEDGRFFFEYGITRDQIDVEDFEQVED